MSSSSLLRKSHIALHLNVTMKAGNKSIDLCCKSNLKELLSDSPISKYVTDPCESMLQTEWRLSSTWTPHRVSQYRWLLIHTADDSCSDESCSDESSEDEESEDESDDEDSDESSEVRDNNEAGSATRKLSSNAFGPIPRFSRVYEVTVEQTSQVFSCTCCHQQRMGIPCRHIASVCRGNNMILGPDPLGFSLSFIRAFWWKQYYLYGMSEKENHQKIRGALLALADNDTQGLPCPTNLDKLIVFPCPESVITLFHLPATDRLLNYDSSTATHAAQSMRNRNNPHQLMQQVPTGLSQLAKPPTVSIKWGCQ
jgi:hypothetical protein